MDNIDFGLVSIIMPNYNSAEYIGRAIESVLAQSYSNWELWFVDDCSTDNSLEIINRYDDPRICTIKNASNFGAAASRNKAIEKAKGRWIAFLDSDDLWDRDKLQSQLLFMDKTQTAFSFTAYKVINNNDEVIAQFFPKKDVYDYNTILKHCYIGCSTVMYDCKHLGKVYMPIEAVKREDFACWLKILKSGMNAACFHQFLTLYRVHNGSVSSNKLKMIKYQWNVYRNIEGLSITKTLYYMINWGINGLFKYKLY